jgi:hypothetical protein
MMIYRHLSFDAERRLLHAADGRSLRLTPKAFDLLKILIGEAPRVVSKTDLHRRLWPETFVSDAALTCLVKELRRVLPRGDGSPMIRTAHGVGYAFDDEPLPAPAVDAVSIHWLVSPQQRFVLHDGVNIIGREPQSEVWLDVPAVSRRHARVVIMGDRAAIEDLGSKNGTVVEGCATSRLIDLNDGDSVRAGGVELTYRRQTADQPTATLAAS